MIIDRIIPIGGTMRVLLPERCTGPSGKFNVEGLRAILKSDQCSVLITGEPGTGKEMMAACAVKLTQPKGKYLRLNCAGLSSTVMESVLFGHEKSAFTGADVNRQSLLKACDGGVIFLNDICSLSKDLQARLASFMETGEIFPIGADSEEHCAKVRIIAATNKDVEKDMIHDLRARFDSEVNLPPLRERVEDILWFLCEPGFLGSQTVFSGITFRTLIGIMTNEWSGNIRDLKKYCQRKVTLNPGKDFTCEEENYILEDLDICRPKTLTTVTEFAGLALGAFEAYVKENPKARENLFAGSVAALLAGLYSGVGKRLYFFASEPGRCTVVPLEVLRDAANGTLQSVGEFDLDTDVRVAIAKVDLDVAAVVYEERIMNNSETSRTDMADAFRFVLHAAEAVASMKPEVLTRTGVEGGKPAKVPVGPSQAFLDKIGMAGPDGVLFAMPPPPSDGSGGEQVFDQRGIGEPDQSIALSMIKDRIVEIEGKGRVLLPERCTGPSGKFNVKELRAILASDQHSLLITGEPGTGKEMLAHCAKKLAQPKGKFLPLNCAGFSNTQMEIKLFGHEKGISTGADADGQGLLRACDGGVLFLKDICSLSKDLQARLARFMDTGEISRIGADSEEHSAKVRIIAATNKDVNDDKVMIPELREKFDIEVHLPPLRERAGDILWYLCDRDFRGSEVVFTGITLRTLMRILTHEWRGNIRELNKYCKRQIGLSGADRRDVEYHHILDATDCGSEPVLDLLSNFAGISLAAFEEYAKEDSIKTSDATQRALVLLTGICFGLKLAVTAKLPWKWLTVIPFDILRDFVNADAMSGRAFDLKQALMSPLKSKHPDVVQQIEQVCWVSKLVDLHDLQLGSALERIIDFARIVNAKCPDNLMRRTNADGKLDWLRIRPSAVFCESMRVKFNEGLVFSMPTPPSGGSGAAQASDQSGIGEVDRNIAVSCDKELSNTEIGASGTIQGVTLKGVRGKKVTEQLAAPSANRSCDFKIIDDYMTIRIGKREIDLSKKFKARNVFRFLHTRMKITDGTFLSEEIKEDYNKQFGKDQENRKWKSDRFREDLFRGMPKENFDCLFETLDKAAGRYRLKIM